MTQFLKYSGIFLWCLLLVGVFVHSVHAQTGRTFYIDCISGNNSNNGTSPSSAWKNLSMFNNATIETGDAPQFNVLPGDTFLLKRGCVFDRYAIVANWNGTATSRITFDAYGDSTLPLPIIKDVRSSATSYKQQTVSLSGSYITFQNLHFSLSQDTIDSQYIFVYDHGLYNDRDCFASDRQVEGFWFGINVLMGADNNIIQNNTFTNLAAAINFTNGGKVGDNPPHSHKILHNVFRNNSAVWTNGNPEPAPTGETNLEFIGGMGVNLKGNDHEVAYNRFENNVSKCKSPRDGKWESNAIELYNARRNKVHHNVSIGNRVFSEAGSLQSGASEFYTSDNVWAYNVISSNIPIARFLTLHAGSAYDSPVYNSKVFNNTVYYTGNNSQGVICGGCTFSDLQLKNNIIWIKEKAIYINPGDDIDETNNIYFDGDSTIPSNFFQNITIDSSSRYTSPLFSSLTSTDPTFLGLQPTSPAIDAGTLIDSVTYPFTTTDLAGVTVPQNGRVDIGTYEFTSALSGSPTPTPTRTPTPQSTPTTVPQAVVSFTLVNADTDQDIMQLVDGATIDFAVLGTKNLSVRANTTPGTVGSVQLELDRSGTYQIENNPPYALAGNSGSDYHPWTPTVGSHRLTAVPFTQVNATGVAGTALTVSFTVARIPGDVDGNGKVDIFDYTILLTNFGRTGVTGGASEGDFEPDGDVDIFDYNLLLSNFGG